MAIVFKKKVGGKPFMSITLTGRNQTRAIKMADSAIAQYGELLPVGETPPSKFAELVEKFSSHAQALKCAKNLRSLAHG